MYKHFPYAILGFCLLSLQPGLASSDQVLASAPSNEIFKASRSIIINSTCEHVWPHIVDFGNISKWYSAFKSSKNLNNFNNQVGTIRQVIRASNGQEVQEELIYRNDLTYELAYTHVKNSPVRETINQVKLDFLPDRQQCFVTWSSTFRINQSQRSNEVTQFFMRAFDKALFDLKVASES